MSPLPSLSRLHVTQDYLQDVAKVLGKLQQVFLSADPHDWQRGLLVTMRGLSTQAFSVDGRETRASIDLVKHKMRLDGNKWLLENYSPTELLNNVRAWLEMNQQQLHIEEPEFSAGVPRFAAAEAEKYGAALWWMDEQFQQVKARLEQGLVSPVLVYPHHFDLSLSWFPFDDERQFTLGWSIGDETIHEPYVYLTAYPEPAGFTKLKLPLEARWQHEGFSGATLTYEALRKHDKPAALLAQLAQLMTDAEPLLGSG